jgi:proteasome lid subunit RPN8/RPN11
MSLKIPAEVAAEVHAHAERAYPEECCGFLIGPVPDRFERLGREVAVEEARPLPNGWESGQRATRYQIDPRTFVKVEAELAGTGRGIVGLYHSHPNVPAWPSPFDLERAWPCYSYWIVSVREGRTANSRSWMRSEDGADFVEEPLLIEELAGKER